MKDFLSPSGLLKRLKVEEKGGILPLVAISMVALLGMTALVVDVGGLYLARRQMVNAADAAALAGAQEFLQQPSIIEAVARKYAVEFNGADADKVTVEVCQDSNTVTVEAARKVEFSFARALGFSDSSVSARAVALLYNPSVASGLVPFTIPDNAYEEGKEVTLVRTDWDEEMGPGNFGLLAFAEGDRDFDPGAKVIEDRIIHGFDGEVYLGQEIYTEPGQNVGQLRSGVNTRVEKEPRIIIPVFDNSETITGRDTVKVVGFAAFELYEYIHQGNVHEVAGKFEKFLGPGSVKDETGPDYGAFSVALIE